MLKKVSEVDFYKLFTVIGGYLLFFFGAFHLLQWMKSSTLLIYAFVVISVVVSALLVLTLYKLRKKRHGHN
ncbi:hypothetical protein [Photobacterium lutimaris]|uniref:Uncharacterized protein n=1 Tax=Photobacterium lutimaris TaxID=388278 RepID=A0A2T3J3I9_9GAMM|nr:hypothetical protein [Photobacterium lutimaris]PSU35860.1 hypothetical protein C9I99_02235 [Photobacterium lutimaris]TDR78932.1 hypothetical protein DFP78_101446 [Photobacterium lutimaris]